MSAVQFKRIEDRAVDEAIALQEHAGLDVVTDGEQRRPSFAAAFAQAVEGIEPRPSSRIAWHGDRDVVELDFPLCVTDKVRWKQSPTSEEYLYASARTRKPVKVTLPSPLLLLIHWSPVHSREAYADPFELFWDAAALIRDEVRLLTSLGCEYVQIDAPELGLLVDASTRGYLESIGVAPARLATEGAEILNFVAEGVHAKLALHLCRGNASGRWLASGGYGALSQELFRRATNFDTFLLEYDDPRSGSFEPLADLADEKVAVLGLISTKRNELESIDELIARIGEASRFLPLERLAISPQCGFASVWEGNPISSEVQREKLELVAAVARRVWN